MKALSGQTVIWVLLALALAAPAAMADERQTTGDQQAAPAAAAAQGSSSSSTWRTLGACFAAAGAAAGGGLAIAKIAAKCLDSMARQPEAAGQMFGPMLIAAAMVEGAMLFAILVCLLTVFTA
jgi:F-type H+-transporting ATPase subunit c